VLVKSIDNQYDPGNFGKSRVTERMRHHVAVLIDITTGKRAGIGFPAAKPEIILT